MPHQGTPAQSLSPRQSRAHQPQLRKLILAAAVAAALIGQASAALAVDTWSGNAGSANWKDGANWLGGNIPQAGDSLIFAGTTRLTNNNDFDANTAFAGITFASDAGAFTLGGNPVLLTGDVNNNSSSNQTLGFAATQIVANGNFTYTGGGTVLDGSTVNVNNTGAGTLSLGQVTFGQAPQSPNVSTLNVNNSASAAGLTVMTKSTSANVINIATGQTFTVAGNTYLGTPSVTTEDTNVNTNVNFTGGGSLSATAGNFYVGLGSQNFDSADRNVARVDMTALSSFSYTGGGNFGVGWMTRPDAQLRLSAGTNTITASQLQVGSSGITGTTSSPNNSGTTATLFLGAGTNVLNVANITIGNVKGVGIIDWVDADNGSVVIAGQTGGTSTANITLGRQSSATGSSGSSELRLAGHNATVQSGTVIIGQLAGATSATATGAITFDTGTFSANSLQIAANASGNDPNGVRGTFTLGTSASSTGTLTVNTQFLLGNDTNTNDVPTRATFVMNGGTANINSDIQVIRNGANGSDEATLTLNGGTLNMGSHNIGSSAAPVITLNLGGGTLNSTGAVNATNVTATAQLSVAGTPTLALTQGGTLTNNTGSTLSLPNGLTLAGGAGGTATVNGDVEATGGSRISAGDAATLGTLQFNSNLTFDAGSILRAKISDAGGTDAVNVSGTLTLNGVVNVEVGALGLGGTVGQTYTIATAGTVAGTAANLSVAGNGSRKTFTPVVSDNQIKVQIGGSGPLSLTYTGSGSSVWTLGGSNNWTNGSPQAFFNLDSVTFDDSSTNVAPVSITGTVTPGAVTVNAARNYTFAGAGSIAGSDGITKQNSGTLVVATNNTYTGTTDIQQGTVQVGDGGTSGSLGTGQVNDNGTLVFNRSDSTTFANAISGSGNVVAQAGTVLLSGANTYDGTTTIKSGATLKPASGAALGSNGGGDVTIENGGTLDLGAAPTFTGPPTLFGSSKVFHISGTGVGGVGAITNSSANNQLWAFEQIKLEGDALITGGRMDIGRDTGGTRSLDLNGKTLTLNLNAAGSQPILSILDGTQVSAGNIVVQGGALGVERGLNMDNVGGTVTFQPGSNLQGFQTADGAVKRPMIFKGNNLIGSGNGTIATINSDMQLDGNVTLQSLASGAAANNNNPLELKGAITGVGGITKVGLNSVTLSGAQTYAGATAVTGGTLLIGGNSTGSSSLSVSDGATVQLKAGSNVTLKAGSLNLNASGKLDLADGKLVIGTTTPDQLTTYIAAGRNGGSWNAAAGLTTSNSLDSLHGIGFAPANVAGVTTWGAATGLTTETVVGIAAYGDLNMDGKVNADDYIRLDRGNAKHLTGWFNGDVDYSGAVDSADYLLVDTSFVDTGIPHDAVLALLAQREAQFGPDYVSQLLAAVPEPSAASLLLAAGGLLAKRRRK